MKKRPIRIDKTDGLWPWGTGFSQIIPETDPIRSDVGIHEIPFEIPVQAEDDP